MQETSSYEDLVAEPAPPAYSAFEFEQLIAQASAFEFDQPTSAPAIPSTSTHKFRMHRLSAYIGRTRQSLYLNLERLHIRLRHKEKSATTSPVMEDLVYMFNYMASKIEALRMDIQDSVAQHAMIEVDSQEERRRSI